MASGGNSSSTTDRSITAQDSEIVDGSKQTLTALGDLTNTIVGDNSTVVDGGAFDMVGKLGSQFLATVGDITNDFLNAAAAGVQTVANATSPQSATVAGDLDTKKTLRLALIVAGAVAVVYVFRK